MQFIGKQEVKRLVHAIRIFLGFYKNPPEIEEQLKNADVRSTRNLSLFISTMELWMIVRQLIRKFDRFTSVFDFFYLTRNYWILLSVSLLLFFYSALYLGGRLKRLKHFSRLFTFLYFLLGIYFGIKTTLYDISHGRMITCFLTMALMMSLIVVWRPFISIMLALGSGVVGAAIINNYAVGTDGQPWRLSDSETINYSIYMITLAIVAISMYSQRHRDARKTYLLQQAKKHEAQVYRAEKQKQEAVFVQTTQALASAIDAKDHYTQGHSARVAEYSLTIARKAGKNDAFCREVYFAALLHDVGKIGIAGSIINKCGRLTEDEFNEIKKHTVIGYEILMNIEHSPNLSIGAHFHHERFDGKGYPEGLSGEQIPEIARIIAVADAYDAMTSKRSYRDVLPQEVVKSEIERGSGMQFDPKYAAIMLEMIAADHAYRLREP